MSQHMRSVAALLEDMRQATAAMEPTLEHLERANQAAKAEKQRLAARIQLIIDRLECERLASANQ